MANLAGAPPVTRCEFDGCTAVRPPPQALEEEGYESFALLLYRGHTYSLCPEHAKLILEAMSGELGIMEKWGDEGDG